MPASGHQDHTTSPSASGALVSGTIRVHRIPPHVRDDRETPLSSGGTPGIKKVICMKREEEKFLKKGLDSVRAKRPDGQISWIQCKEFAQQIEPHDGLSNSFP